MTTGIDALGYNLWEIFLKQLWTAVDSVAEGHGAFSRLRIITELHAVHTALAQAIPTAHHSRAIVQIDICAGVRE